MSTTLRDEHAGLCDEKPSRLENQIEAALADDRQHARGVLRRGRHALAFVRDAEPSADVEVLDGDAGAAQLGGEGHQRLGGAPERLELGDLRADVAVQSDDLHAAPAAHAQAHLAGVGDGHAELVALQAGRDVRMALRVDVRVDAHGDAGLDAAGRGDGVDPLDLPFRLGIDAAQPEADGALELRIRLADAGEDDLRRREAGAQRDVDLADRVRVGGRAEAAQQARDAQRRVGLERVMQSVRISAEGLLHFAVAGGDRAGVVDVERSAEACGELCERQAVAVDRALDAFECRQGLSILS